MYCLITLWPFLELRSENIKCIRPKRKEEIDEMHVYTYCNTAIIIGNNCFNHMPKKMELLRFEVILEVTMKVAVFSM